MILAIETGIEPEYETALQYPAYEVGWDVVSVQNIPFTNTFVTGDPNIGQPLDKDFLNNEKVWFHGSIQAAKRAIWATSWQIHAPWHQLRCTTYYSILKDLILQKDHRFSTIGQLPVIKDELFDSLGEDDTIFIRPDGNDKAFNGGCLSRDEFEKGFALINFYEPSPDTKIVIARPQKILEEARFLVVDGKLITGSYYRIGSQSLRLEASSMLMEIAEDILQKCLKAGFNPAPSWVLDLAKSSDGWRIIEVGATSCCGLYKCDPLKFIQALNGVTK